MWYKKIRFILLFIILSGVIGCKGLDILGNMGRGQVQGKNNNIFNEGKTYIRLEEVKGTKGSSKAILDHPKYLRKDILTSVFSSIYFKEKGITGWGKEQNIFQESELLNLTPHIVDAFTKAPPLQYILVNSNYTKGKGFFKSEVYTIFGLFISNDKLNVVFSRIQYEDLVGKGADNVFGETGQAVFVDPFSITQNPFWKISLRSGQQFKTGHGNWLIIDLEEGAFVSKEDYGKEVALGKKQEEVNLSGTTQTVSGSQPVIVQQMSITDQLLELKELETTGLITKEDYELRKTLILGSKKEKSIKDKFNDLRKLKEDGFISDIDYEHKKRDILEENDEKEMGKNIKEVLAVYLELRDEGYITDEDYDHKKKKLLKEF
ncbi:MAG: SHOCT domain-containing protein [Planctomycetota bacterium]